MPPDMGRRSRIPTTLAALALLVPACQMEMGIGTKLNRDGSGTFSMALAVDKEFVDGLGQAANDPAAGGEVTGIEGFDEFFDSLKAKGWRVKTERTAAGDVAYSGRCDFPNPAGFDACLTELSGAEGGDDAFSFKDSGLRFDFRTERGFFKTKSIFGGTVNLAAPGANEQMTKAVAAIASRVFRFEVRADLPGNERVVKGAGVVRDGVVVWRPLIGEKIDFRAESSAYNPAAIVAVALPLLGLLGLVVGRLARRRPPAAGPEGFVPADPQNAEPADVIDRGSAS